MTDNNYGVNRGTTGTQGNMAGNHAGSNGAAAPYLASQPTGHANAGSATMDALVNQFSSFGVDGIPLPIPGLTNVPYMHGSQIHLSGGFHLPALAGARNVNVSHYPAIPGGEPYFLEQGYVWPAQRVNFNTLPQEVLFSKEVREYLAKHDPTNLYLAKYNSENLGAPQQDLPGLENNRRSSYSTTESTPATPFYGSTASRDPGNRVAVYDPSTYTTPSPSSALAPQPKSFPPAPAPIDRDLQVLLAKDPAIPSAVPAVFTPQENMKTLEQSLTNHIAGNRNVYIRGLHPTTDDDLLLKYAERFGHVETSKAIIDTTTGACKGFGFAKFQTVRESETCIRGFFALGYEVGFARVTDKPLSVPGDDGGSSPHPSVLGASAHHLSDSISKQCGCACDYHSDKFTDFDPWDQESFNSRLKAEGDENSTNLYISNLPKSVTENELAAIFIGYTILSSKILRDGLGNSRGVGFARFENREICDEIISSFTGQPLGDEGLHMQIRYADTPAQKELKRITAERRQFRTNEYNVGAYGTPLVGMPPTLYSQPGWKRGISNGSTSYPRGPTFDRHLKNGIDDVGQNELAPSKSACGGDQLSDDDSGDEGVTIHVDTPLVAHGTTQSSPIKKEED